MNLLCGPFLMIRRKRVHRLLALGLLVCAMLITSVLLPNVRAQAQAGVGLGEWYTVQRGDTWYALARRFGLSVHELQAANPAHLHYRRGSRVVVAAAPLILPTMRRKLPRNLTRA
jgi:hypothetical protein